MRTISSSLTYFLKFLLPPLWTMLVLGVYWLLGESPMFGIETMHYVIVWLTVNVAIFFNISSLKEVSVDDKQLYVSNFRETEVIPFSEVEYVSGSRFALPEQVWFRVKDKRIIVFLPKTRFSILQFHRHPMVEELAELCGLDDW